MTLVKNQTLIYIAATLIQKRIFWDDRPFFNQMQQMKIQKAVGIQSLFFESIWSVSHVIYTRWAMSVRFWWFLRILLRRFISWCFLKFWQIVLIRNKFWIFTSEIKCQHSKCSYFSAKWLADTIVCGIIYDVNLCHQHRRGEKILTR